MVAVAVATHAHRTGLASLLRLVRSRLLQLALSIHNTKLRPLLPRVAAAGSAYATLALIFGGFYEKPWQLPGVALRVVYTIVLTLCEYVARGRRPLFREWTLSFELVRAVTRCVMSNYGDRMLVAKCAQHIRLQSDVAGLALGYAVARRLGSTTTSFYHNDLEHLWVHSTPLTHTKKRRRRVVVLYFHGGGYAVLSPRMYISFACELQHRIRDRLHTKLDDLDDVEVDILLANYRKIPEHPHPVPVLDAVAMYKYLIEDLRVAPSEIIVAGDSAGGGLAMATLLRLRAEDTALLPLAGLLSCPFVDLQIGGDERKVPYCIIGDKAGMAIYAAYHPRTGEPSTWGDASPVHCDLQGLPPVYIQAAELDYILPHSTRLFEKAKADGALDWDLEIFPNVPHVFSFFPTALLPSATQGLDAMAEYAATRFAFSLQKAPPA